ncbi:peptidylprolyl isomerase [Sphingomonas sp. ID1715]|uniref:peptidylprolyl isomerase n=1 Tax=Sphingomonas sp. ID1715 TaxID=1656898 RepID=UPI001487A65D|nr:peptidylprolyl isomerase [Sphingomonas sp. ID1715]NNM75786.1 peptidylprolyl isomerase [Sphingomonas sp. ID1715]
MLDLFRRLSKSKIGGLVFILFIAALALGFVAADIKSLGVTGGSATGDTVAKIGSAKIGYAELQQRVQRAFDNARQEKPELTIQQFVQQGGVDQVLAQLTDSIAIEQFAREQGIGVSRKMEDAQIAAAPAFRSLNGSFDQSAYEAFLARQRVSEKQLRADLARDLYLSQVLVPTTGAALAPTTLALPYASMLLEQRTGRAQFVPIAAFRGAAPSDAELTDFYRRNAARYTIPERRVARYALIDRTTYEASAQPSEQEIAEAYKANQAQFAGKETRTISQVIVQTEEAARAMAAKLAAGTPIAEAARAIGLESVTLNDQSRDDYTKASSPAVAAAVFATAEGKVAAPARSGLGWHVVRVDRVSNTATRTLDQVRGELVAQLKTKKAEQGWADAIAKVEDAVNDGATFDEVVAANKLQPVTTAPLLRSGQAADTATQASPELVGVAKSVFSMEAGDDPVVEQLVPDRVAALIKTEQVIAPAPRPLAQIREQVVADFLAERGRAGAQRAAAAIASRINNGAPLAQAVAAAGAPLPSAAAVSGRRGETLQQSRPAPPQLAALFGTRRGKARIVAAPDGSGWYVVTVETVVPGDARSQPPLIESTRAQFAPVLGQEYAQQLAAAARRAVGIDVNAAAVARLKSELIGGNAPAQ